MPGSAEAAAAGDAGDARRAIVAHARALGFEAVGVASAAGAPADADALRRFVELGYAGDMAWLSQTAERRSSPRALWPAARSVVAVGLNYGPAHDPLHLLGAPTRGIVSAYAQGRDYHAVMKTRLRRLARYVAESFGAEVKLFVDTAPVMEKPLAARAGLGWQGKHTNLVSRRHGSWLFLGALFTTLDLAPDESESDRCGSCRRCLDICPTDAFPAPYRLDARRCISYLTIEHKGHIAPAYPRGHGQQDLRLRRLPGGVPVEQVRAPHRGVCVPAARRVDGAPPRRPRRAGRRVLQGGLLRQPDQADRARPLRAQRADRHRQLRRRPGLAGGRAAALGPLPAGTRHGGLGVRAARAAGRPCGTPRPPCACRDGPGGAGRMGQAAGGGGSAGRP